MAIKIAGVFPRTRFLPCPDRNGDTNVTGSAAVFALAASAKGDRLFIHRQRHTRYANLHKLVAAVEAKGAIDPQHWAEVDYRSYTLSGAVILKDGGEIVHAGFGSDETEVPTEASSVDVSGLKKLASGWSLT